LIFFNCKTISTATTMSTATVVLLNWNWWDVLEYLGKRSWFIIRFICFTPVATVARPQSAFADRTIKENRKSKFSTFNDRRSRETRQYRRALHVRYLVFRLFFTFVILLDITGTLRACYFLIFTLYNWYCNLYCAINIVMLLLTLW